MSVRPVTKERDRVKTGKCWRHRPGWGGCFLFQKLVQRYLQCMLSHYLSQCVPTTTEVTLFIIWPQCCQSRPVVSSTRTTPQFSNQANTGILTGALGEDLICTRPFVYALQCQRTTWLNKTPFIIGCHPGLPYSMWLWVWDWSVGVRPSPVRGPLSETQHSLLSLHKRGMTSQLWLDLLLAWPFTFLFITGHVSSSISPSKHTAFHPVKPCLTPAWKSQQWLWWNISTVAEICDWIKIKICWLHLLS